MSSIDAQARIVLGSWSESSLPIVARPGWQAAAACRGKLDVFFGSEFGRDAGKRANARESAAKRICEDCKVIDDCLQFALGNNERHGVWGGLSTSERDAILTSRQVKWRTPKAAS